MKKIFKVNNYLLLHFIILLWGFTPVLGKLISLEALDLVFWRLVFSAASLYIYLRFKGSSIRVSLRDFMILGGWGVIVGLHWFFFYHAIKVANVSIALAGFSTITCLPVCCNPFCLKRNSFGAMPYTD